MTTVKNQILESLRDPEYRREFRHNALRTRLAAKIREMRDDRGWTQKQLGEIANKPQAVVSRLENQNYGKFSLATLEELAAAFDVHLYVDFVRFSRLATWMADGYPEEMTPPAFDADYDAVSTRPQTVGLTTTVGWKGDSGALQLGLALGSITQIIPFRSTESSGIRNPATDSTSTIGASYA